MDKYQHLQRLLAQFQDADKKSTIKDYRDFIWVLCRIIDNLNNAKSVKIEWHEHLEIQLINFSFSCSTFSNLAEGSKLITHKLNIPLFRPDFYSIFTLGRAQIEQYLMINYLNFNPIDESQGVFRNLLFKASGLNNRQKYPAANADNIKKLTQEKEELEKLIAKIKANQYFKSLPYIKQERLLQYLPAREYSTRQFIDSLKLKNTYYKILWSLYSNYAHSEFISIFQSRVYYLNDNELNKTILTSLNVAMLTITLLINDLVKAFKSAEIIYNTVPSDILSKLEFLSSIANKQDP